MSFFGLFGRDQNPAAGSGPFVNLPKPPPAAGGNAGFSIPELPPIAQAPPIVEQLPKAPPVKKASAFDNDHYRQTMLALAAGFFGSQNFGDGLANAARTIYNQNESIRDEGRPVLGGPDDAFEIYTDPQTGERTYKPVKEFTDYNTAKRTKQKDVADINGRVMYAIQQLPEADRAAAYQDVLTNPDFYGVDPEAMPREYSRTYGSLTSNMGMTVSQALTRAQAAASETNRESHRDAADADRARRTEIYGNRASAATAQGDARIGLAREALDYRKAGGGSGKGGGGGGRGKKPRASEMDDTTLLNIIFGK